DPGAQPRVVDRVEDLELRAEVDVDVAGRDLRRFGDRRERGRRVAVRGEETEGAGQDGGSNFRLLVLRHVRFSIATHLGESALTASFSAPNNEAHSLFNLPLFAHAASAPDPLRRARAGRLGAAPG